jgi:uncharacterized protein (TIGR00251 family)
MVKRSGSLMTKAIWETARGTLLRALVRPNSKAGNLIAEVTPEAIHINLRGPARDGKANVELLKRLSKMLGLSTADISIVAGYRSREKTLLIVGVDQDDLLKRLANMT